MRVLVLGGGVVGVTAAWYLAADGHEVTLVDRQPGAALETSYANGGQISASYAEPWANPEAPLKVFLTATAEARAERRYKQLIDKGMSANIDILLQDLRERDARDSARAVAPLQKCADAELLDTTAMTVDEAVTWLIERVRQRLPQAAARS